MNAQHRTRKAMFAASLMSMSMTSAFAATTYQVTPIYSYGSASVINESGVIAGVSSETPVIYDANNQPITLPESPSGFTAQVYDINASSQIVYDDLGSTFLWQNGVNKLLGFAAFGINDAGTITGGNELGALIYQNGTIIQLPGGNAPGVASSLGFAINNSGHVAGTSAGNAALWIDGNRIDLGRLSGASDGYAYGINENDQVVGSSGGRAFLWQNGVMQELPTIAGAASTEARRINNNGEIVGHALVPFMNGYQPKFLYWKDGVVTDLTLVVPNGGGASGPDINDQGQIAANGYGSFRLTPAAPGADVGVSIYTTTSGTQYGRINLGQQVAYKIDVGNTGSFNASNVVVRDAFPSNVTFISATPSKGSCSFSGTLVCSMGNLASGARESITVTLLPTVTGTFDSSVSVSMNETDVNSVNNTGFARVNIAEITADVSLTMSGPSSVKRYSDVNYTINVKNQGTYDANNVTLTDVLPSGLQFVSVTTDRGTCSGTANGAVSCNLGNFSVGVSAKLTLKARAISRGTFTNTATSSSSTKDPNSGNNSARVTTTVK